MRLSPKSIFFGLVALGLPVAVTVGWQLATPAARSAAIDTPGGAGGLGDAPARHTKPAPAVDSSATPSPSPSATLAVSSSTLTPASGGPVLTSATATPTGTPSVSPTEASHDPLPPLTLPPVPTPTEPDANPSATPSASFEPPDTPFIEQRFRWSGH